MYLKILVGVVIVCSNFLRAELFQHVYTAEEKNKTEVVWHQPLSQQIVDDVHIACNLLVGKAQQIELSVRWQTAQGWSSWLLLAQWKNLDDLVRKYSLISFCTPKVPHGSILQALEVKMAGQKVGDLVGVHSVTASVSSIANIVLACDYPTKLPTVSVDCGIGYAQNQFVHQRAKDLCAPTAISVALNIMLKKENRLVDPLIFADNAYDPVRDIYGSWFFNSAFVYPITDGFVVAALTRLPSFAALHAFLQKGLPVVVSVVGPLVGGAGSYRYGHLLTIVGWDEPTQSVVCRDSAFDADEKTLVVYPLEAFMQAWQRRQGFAYLFKRA